MAHYKIAIAKRYRSGTRVQFDIAVVGVRLAGQQALDFPPLRLIGRRPQRCHRFGRHCSIPVSLGQFDQFQRVGNLGFQLQDALHGRGNLIPLPHQLLRGGRIVP